MSWKFFYVQQLQEQRTAALRNTQNCPNSILDSKTPSSVQTIETPAAIVSDEDDPAKPKKSALIDFMSGLVPKKTRTLEATIRGSLTTIVGSLSSKFKKLFDITSSDSSITVPVVINSNDNPAAPKKSALIDFMSGIVAGIADTITNYPPYGLHYRRGRGTNPWQKKYFRLRELYRGVGPYSAIIPVTCLMDGLTEIMKEKGIHPAIASFAAGVTAGMLIGTPVGNMIVTDQRLADQEKPAGSRNAIRNVIETRGYSAFTTGVQWIMLREGTYSFAVFFGKNAVKKQFDCNDFVASCVSGTIASIITQPMDTSATWMMNQEKRPSILYAIKQMYKEEKLKRFYRGFYFRWYTVIMGIYIMDKASQYTKKFLSGSK